jgi:uncharacterized CHY-type Zn-finger protein
MTETETPWCGTCGKDITEEEYYRFEGDCFRCHEWWEQNKEAISDG